MKYAILSDVHANLTALEAVLADARRMGAEEFVSLGDTVGYGPLPAAALERIRKTCAVTLAGNHDDAVSGRCDAKDFIGLAADAVARHRAALDADALGWLGSLPYVAEIEGAVCAHGDFVDPPKFFYIEDEADAAANFNVSGFTLAFVGHTHRPAIFLTGRSGTFYRTDPQDFTLEDGKRYLVNVGSVGYPREQDGICRSSYVLYDSTARTVEFRFLPFAVSSVMERGRGPKTRRKLLAALGALALAALAACAWSFSRPAARQVAGTAPKDDPRLVLTNRTLAVGRDPASCRASELRANLKLARDSAPANLRIRYRDANDRILSEETLTVRKSLTKNLIDSSHPLPADACEVNLTVLRTKAGDAARIARFEPALR